LIWPHLSQETVSNPEAFYYVWGSLEVAVQIKLTRWWLLAVCFVGVLAQAATGKPNILVIFGDDIGYSNISAYSLGMTGYKTPNIDRLAKELSSPISMGNRVARRVAQRSSLGNIHSARVC
jgi:hypothetical protein